MSTIPRKPPALVDASLEYLFASSSNASPACNRLCRPAASSSVFTTIRRTPIRAGCWPHSETAIVSIRKESHRRLLRMTDLLLDAAAGGRNASRADCQQIVGCRDGAGASHSGGRRGGRSRRQRNYPSRYQAGQHFSLPQLSPIFMEWDKVPFRRTKVALPKSQSFRKE